MDKPKCCAGLWDRVSRRNYPCGCNASVKRDGEWYCKRHDPVAIKVKDSARKAKWEADWEKTRLAHNRRRLEAEALSGVADEHLPTILQEVRAVLEKCVYTFSGVLGADGKGNTGPIFSSKAHCEVEMTRALLACNALLAKLTPTNKEQGMPYKNITPNDDQIDDVLNQCSEAADNGSKYPGMSYEQGVEAGIAWLIGESRGMDHPHPLED